MSLWSGRGCANLGEKEDAAITRPKDTRPGEIADEALDAVFGGPLEVREMTVKVTVDDTASRDAVAKGKDAL